MRRFLEQVARVWLPAALRFVRAAWARRWVRMATLVSAGVLVLGTGVWFFIPPDEVTQLGKGSLKTWSKLRAEQKERGKNRVTFHYVSLSSIPVDLQLAVLSGEDIGFFFHDGWDTAAMREAITEWLSGDDLRGASTLTQQLAKNLFLSEERSFIRKLREARYAYWLEDKLSKKRILELYLNIVELGPGVLGVEAGARRYFGVSASALSADQAAQLAASIPSPLKHNPSTRTGAFSARYKAITSRMARYDNIRARLLR